MAEFVHLHNHSYYSLLDGLSSPKDLVKQAKKLGYSALALTDHGTCGGLFNFQKACLDEGIKPILGMEAYTTHDRSIKEKGTPSYHLVLLAKNEVGYRNLIKLSTLGYTDGFYYRPRVDFELLERHKEGLIVTSACSIGEIPTLLFKERHNDAREIAQKYKDIFGDDFYLEIMTHKYYASDQAQEDKEKKLANLIYKLAKDMGIKAICTNDVHYALEEEWEAQDVLLAVQTHNHIKNPDRMTFSSRDFYLKPAEKMAERYGKVPELLKNTLEIAEKIEGSEFITSAQDLLPSIDIPAPSTSEEEYLKCLVKKGMRDKGLLHKPEYRERIKYEMSVLLTCGFTKYFLVLWDIMNFARENGIRVGAGRGSAVSSLVLYVLGITKIDPIPHGLIFERFLNPERISPPDVDVDFDYNRRSEVYDYIINKYGEDHCSQIGTYNSFKARATVRYVAKAIDIGGDWEILQEAQKNSGGKKVEPTKHSLDMADEIAKLVPNKPVGITIEEAMKAEEVFKRAMMDHPQLFRCAKNIEGTLSAGGVHPAGIIVCKDPIIEHIPMRLNKGVVCSQFDGPEVEDVGLLKFDLLALKTLTVLERTVQMVKERRGIDLDIDALEPNDTEIFAMLNGKNKKMDALGVFQFEKDGISKLLRQMHVDSFDDMIVVNALYRPGPLQAGLHNDYVSFKHGHREIEYLHPKMGEILDETYGIMVYQESIMKVSQELAGFTGGQADTLRKVIGKKKPELIKKERLDELFIEGCKKNGVDVSVAKAIFAQMYQFAGYGFNKSHACAYAFIAYQCCYLKRYYPFEFMCNLLTSEINNNDKDEKLERYEKAALRMDIVCRDHHINKSGLEYAIESGVHKETGEPLEFLRKPLTTLKGVGSKAVQSIVENQPYRDLEEFARKIDGRVVNKAVFAKLVESGCMDCFKMKHSSMLDIYPQLRDKISKEKKAREKQKKEREKYGESPFTAEAFDYSGSDVEI